MKAIANIYFTIAQLRNREAMVVGMDAEVCLWTLEAARDSLHKLNVIARKIVMHLIIYTDGGARGNPGPAGAGVVIYQEKGDGEELAEEFGKYIGEATNNVAEYTALLLAIQRAREMGATSIDFMMDSELVVRQMKREYKVKDAGLAVLFVKVWNEIPHFKKVTFTHIPREKNKAADKMVNEAIDKARARH